MNGKELKRIQERIDQEDFHYAFHHYSSFEEVKDEEFHQLREAYIRATQQLADYLGVEP
jgi:hypothetical protein